MSEEPGMTLSRAVALEKNALAAIEIAKMSRREADDLRQRVTHMETGIAALKVLVDQNRAALAVARYVAR